MEEYDVIIVGAGPGGYLSAIRMAKLGAKVLVLDGNRVGGECLNYACIPSKTLLTYLSSLESAHELLNKECMDVDYDVLRSIRDDVVEKLVRGIEHIFKRLGVVYRNEEAISITDHIVSTASEVYRGEYIVLATGSKPRELPGVPFDGEYVWSSRDALKLPRRVRSICIVGGGAAGLEIASIYNLLGAEVYVVELLDRIAPFMDSDISRRLKRLLSRSGIKIHTGSKVDEVAVVDGGVKVKIVSSEGNASSLECDALVVTIGRVPNLGIGGDVSRLSKTREGYVIVDEYMRTSIDYIYAVGDVTGPPLLAHKAYWDALTVSEYLFGSGKINRPKVVPYVIYSIPGAFSVGLGEEESRLKGIDCVTHTFPLSGLGSSRIIGGDQGFVKVVCDDSGRVLGIHGVSNKVTELVGVACVAVELGLSIDELANVMFPHPTYSEAYWELFNLGLGRGLHHI